MTNSIDHSTSAASKYPEPDNHPDGARDLGSLTPSQPPFGHGGNARNDEEVRMSDVPFREAPPGTKRLYWRFDPDMTDEEIQAWASAFVDAVLGVLPPQDEDRG